MQGTALDTLAHSGPRSSRSRSSRSQDTAVRRGITPTGWVAIAVLPLGVMSIWLQTTPTGLAVGISLAILLGISWPWCKEAVMPISARWLLPAHAVFGEPCSIGCQLLCARKRGPLSLHWGRSQGARKLLTPLPSAQPGTSQVAWSERFTQRGMHTLPPLSVVCSRPLGLLVAERQCSDEASILVLPAIAQVRPEAMQVVMAWLDSGFHADSPGHDEPAHIRPYRHGDPMRMVHWRASARMRSIMVLERHAPQGRQISMVIDTRGPKRHSRRFERLLCAAASMLSYLSQHGWTISLRGNGIPGGITTGSLTHLLETIARIECGASDDGPLRLPAQYPCLLYSLDEAPVIEGGEQYYLITPERAEQLVRIPRTVR
ncbi:MAG: DUF58 domain-containing protein [Planctomycetota bacterium]|nr:MAG: DUF58 domain-containing protein [Planctomycetota bacterium]